MTSPEVNGAAPANGPSTSANGQTPAPSLPQLQVIDDNQQFNAATSDAIANTFRLSEAGFDYNVLAVFGSQSTGKSTLLNKLFGTGFAVMDSAQRRQTTKGIWLSRPVSHPLLIMDVEGADGRERGEQQDFERRTALFSLAVAEVVVVNMWEHQVGLYQGANMGLLKTVFDVNVQLFAARGSPKTLLVFVIRDHLGVTPLDALKRTLMDDLERIWEGLNKPPAVGEAPLEEFFDLDFIGLPHKYNAPEAFDTACDNLRQRFLEPSTPGFLFKKTYHKKLPPADGFPHYAKVIWEKILTAKDLDLPTQQQLLAQYRCDEIAATARKEFGEKAADWTGKVEGGKVVETLGKDMGVTKTGSLATYDASASRYHPSVYQRKRLELVDALDAQCKVLYVKQLQNLAKRALQQFKQELQSRLAAARSDFSENLKEAENGVLEAFEKSSEASKLAETDWSHEDILSAVREDIRELADNAKKDELERTVTGAEKRIANEISETVISLLNKVKDGMWADLWQAFRRISSTELEKLDQKATNFDVPHDEAKALQARLQNSAWEALRYKVLEETSDARILQRLRQQFELRFRYDAKGIPRVWKPEDDIDGAYEKAKHETEGLVDFLGRIDISLEEVAAFFSDLTIEESSLQLLSLARLDDIRERFARDIETLYTDAKRSVINMTAVLPPWAVIAMAVLGWNEFTTVLSSPAYFISFLVVGLLGWFLYSAGLLGTVQNMAVAAGKQAWKPVQTQLEATGLEMSVITERAKSAASIAKKFLEEGPGEEDGGSDGKSSSGKVSPGGWDTVDTTTSVGNRTASAGSTSFKAGMTEPVKR
ncbi:root hair defective 3 GTP-binding protein [Gonapodya prolifera JEL478]|uniref:Root hair defective 3 GTP-binding protein n=1 Tax=Gonapodya prolifera (strain JEL478) TaxID=1344416 RepID=A0A138ZZ08_GONPJ|nr:root hair defective 3 GTP-binding protein [Gonapodya prolifera JEL478]|eukprot:KXS09730.1 root hair defective 3 GTP-binding protein [Gonapodya prolifera JEL478]